MRKPFDRLLLVVVAAAALIGSMFATCAAAQTNDGWQYRIAGGSATTGRLEVLPTGQTQWGTVCDDSFSDLDALVACRSVFPTQTIPMARQIQRYGGGTGPIWMDNVYCTSGATRLSQCSTVARHNCGHYEDVGIQCAPDAWPIELRNSTHSGAGVSSGVVFVKPNASAPWGSICSSSVNGYVARNLCTMLGHDANTTLPQLVFNGLGDFGVAAPANAPLYMNYVYCPLYTPVNAWTNISAMNACTFRNSPGYGCTTAASTSTSTLGLRCMPLTAPATWRYRLDNSFAPSFRNRGLLLVQLQAGGAWGTVCADSGNDFSAVVACRSIGLANANRSTAKWVSSSYFSSSTRPSVSEGVYLTGVRCYGNESSLGECRRNSPGGSCSSYVVLDCNHWEARIQPTGAATQTAGIVQVRPNNTAPWGYVCDDGFSGYSDAAQVCRTLAGPMGIVNSASVLARSSTQYGSRTSGLPVYMDDVSCSSSYSNGVGGCAFSPIGRSYCRAQDEVKISCDIGRVANASEWRASVVNTLLVVNIYGGLNAGPNAYVCASGVGSNAATALCRSLGYRAGVVGLVSSSSAYVQRSVSNHYLAGISCPYGATSLDTCTVHGASASSPCSTYQLARLQCVVNDMPGTAFDTRVVSWQTPGATADDIGRVQVKPSYANASHWGGVCQSTWPGSGNSTTALAFCRAAGFPNVPYATPLIPAYVSHHTANGPIAHGETWVSNVNCNPALAAPDASPPLTSWQQCTYNAPAGTTCTSGVSAAVDCTAALMEARFVLPNGTALPASGLKNFTQLGRLEVRPNSTAPWGTVCDDGFTSVDAVQACQMVGWPVGRTTALMHYAGTVTSQFTTSYSYSETTVPMYMTNVACNSAHSYLNQCPHTANPPFPSCNHYEDVYLTCSALGTDSTVFGWQARIATGSGFTATRGRLEVRPSSTSTWGTVCDDSFGTIDALVACRMIFGANEVISALPYYYPGAGSGTIYMDDVACASTTYTNLGQCRFTRSHNCGHYEDVGVDCRLRTANFTGWQARLVGGVNASEGRLEVRPSSAASWGTVCDDGFSNVDAEAACRALGFWGPGSVAVAYSGPSSPFGRGSGPIYMDDVACASGQTLFNCRYTSDHNCHHKEDVGIRCIPGEPWNNNNTGNGRTDWDYELVRGSLGYLPRRGLLQVRPAAASALGSVCDDSFNNFDATVACRSLGIRTNVSAQFFNVYQQATSDRLHGSPTVFNTGTVGPFYMDDVACRGTEPWLNNCSVNFRHNCVTSEAVLLDCNDWQAELRGGVVTNDYATGRLWIRPNGTAPWGTACRLDTYANTQLALVACGMLAPRTVTSASFVSGGAGRFQPVPSTAAPVYMTNLVCPSWRSEQASLAACGFTEPNVTCYAQRDATDFALECRYGSPLTTAPTWAPSWAPPTPPTAAIWDVRLNRSSAEGLVEVRRRNVDVAWGAVCATGFDDDDAATFCAHLGFTSEHAGWFPAYRSVYGGSVAMSNVYCPPGATSVDSCRSWTPGSECDDPATRSLVMLRCWTPGTPVSTSIDARIDSVTSEIVIRPVTTRRQSAAPDPPADYSHSSYAFCPMMDGSFPASAATFACQETHGVDNALYGEATVVKNSIDPNGRQGWFPVYATRMVCPAAGITSWSQCAFFNQTLDAPYCRYTATVHCVLRQSAASWQATMSAGQLAVRYLPNAPAVRICGSTVNWAVAVAGCRSAFSGSAAAASIDDAIVIKRARTASYTAADFYYECGSSSADAAPSGLDQCEIERYTGGACEVDTVLQCGGVSWSFATGDEINDKAGVQVAARPYPTGGSRPVALSSPDGGLDDATLRVACRSIGQDSSFFDRDFVLVETRFGSVDAPWIVDPRCHDADAPMLSRCEYTFAPYNAQRTYWVVAVRCSVWTTWLIAVVVIAALVVIAVVAIIVYCCVKRKAQRRRTAAAHAMDAYEVDPDDGVQQQHHVEGVVADVDMEERDGTGFAAGSSVVQGQVVAADEPAAPTATPYIAAAATTSYGEGTTPHAAAGAALMYGVADHASNNNASANGTSGEGLVALERQRFCSLVRGHATPTAEPFTFRFLAAVTKQFSTRQARPASSAADPPSVVICLECGEIAAGIAHGAAVTVSVVPEQLAAELPGRVAALAYTLNSPANSAGATCPALYGVAVAQPTQINVTALAGALRCAAPPSGHVFVAVISELAPAALASARTVVADRVTKPAETSVMAAWLARSVATLAEAGLCCSIDPTVVAVRGGGAAGAPFPTIVWADPAAAADRARRRAAMVAGVRALGDAAGSGSLLPANVPESPDALVSQLEAVAPSELLAEGYPPRFPFDPNAPCPLTQRTWGNCGDCGQRPPLLPGTSLVAGLRCTTDDDQAHAFCANCVGHTLGPDHHERHYVRCRGNGGRCSGMWRPEDFGPVLRRAFAPSDAAAAAAAVVVVGSGVPAHAAARQDVPAPSGGRRHEVIVTAVAAAADDDTDDDDGDDDVEAVVTFEDVRADGDRSSAEPAPDGVGPQGGRRRDGATADNDDTADVVDNDAADDVEPVLDSTADRDSAVDAAFSDAEDEMEHAAAPVDLRVGAADAAEHVDNDHVGSGLESESTGGSRPCSDSD